MYSTATDPGTYVHIDACRWNGWPLQINEYADHRRKDVLLVRTLRELVLKHRPLCFKLAQRLGVLVEQDLQQRC